MDLSSLADGNFTLMKFCGLDAEDGAGCINEAVGDMIAEMEDGKTIPIPVCQLHADIIQSQYDVEQVG